MIQKSYDNSPTLFLIPTPIGNLDDITYRTIKILNDVDVLFCEDTRETSQLLNYLKIKKPLISNHKFNETKNYNKILKYLQSGKSVGLVTDRGTPVISDPGYELATFVISQGYNVTALPGATALVPALITSGIKPAPFLFYGFLNSKKSHRIKELENIKNLPFTIIIYESQNRLIDTLNILGNNRKISISREISKKYEEITRGTIAQILALNLEVRGEYVIVISGNNDNLKYQNLTIEEHINLYLQDYDNYKEAIKQVAKERNMKKSEVYDIYLKNRRDK